LLNQAELDEIVASQNLRIPKRPEADTRSVKTFTELRTYVQDEVTFWESTIQEVAQKFREIQNLINQVQNTDINDARNKIARASSLLSTDPSIIDSSTATAQFLKRLAGRDTESAKGAFLYLKRGQLEVNTGYGNLRPFTTSSGMDGILAAALFSHPELLSEKIAAEEAASSAQRSRITQDSDHLKAEFDAIQNQVREWQKASEKRAEDLLSEESAKFEKASGTWHEDHNQKLNALAELNATWQQTFTDLSAAYREKLRLEDPAKYWGDLEHQYIVAGRLWIVATAIAVIVLASWVSLFVYEPPDVFLGDKFTLSGIKGAILVAAGISGFLYFINLVVKVATSSYHLARDARERFQLTHVFLALIKEGAIEAKDREIILSALFSRSDTGLLKNDSGPTLPTPLGSILESLRSK